MTKEEVIEILERFVIGAKPCSQREIVDACASAYRMLKEQPSLPSNMDEAANDYCSAYYDWDDEGERKEVVRTFKAGAEWMSQQGWTGRGVIINSCVTSRYKELETELIPKGVFEVGDKVVVHIRKK